MHKISYTLNNGSTYANPSLEPIQRQVEVIATQDEISHLVNNGYLLLNDIFDNESLKNLNSALSRVCAAEVDHPKTEHLHGVGHYIRYLLDKDEAFHSMLTMERPMSISRAVLGPQIYIDVEARIVPAGVPDMGLSWHIHQRVVPDPLPPFFCYPHAIHGLLYLEDVDYATGPICIIPGSHLKPHLMKIRSTGDVEGQVVLPVKAGTCLLMHANLWHRTLPSTRDALQRRLILFAYSPSWLKADVGHGVIPENPLRENLRKNGNAELRELLGEFCW